MPPTFRRLFEGPDEFDYAPDPMGRVGAGMQEIHDPTDDPRGNELFQDFREAWAEGHDLPDLFGGAGMLDIKEPVGPAARNRRPDVAKLETFLDALGEHDAARTEGPTGFYGIGFEDNLKAYQARNGLTPDGLVNPDGETIGRIKQDLTATLGPGAWAGGADAADGSGPGARLIPVQSSGGSPIGRTPEPPDRERRARQQFLEASRESARRLKRQEKEEFLEASRESERRLPEQVRQLDRKYRLMLWGAVEIERQARPLVNLKHAIPAMSLYLDGKGGTVHYDSDWIRAQPIIKRAEDRVLSHFGDWMRGKPLRPGASPPDIASKILKLKPGESVGGDTDRSAIAKFVKPTWRDKITDFYNTSKKSNIKGIGSFSFTRKGNTIYVTGIIDQKWRDKFDFEPGKVIEIPYEGSPVRVITDELIFLRGVGKARTFQQRSSWQRRVVGQIEIVRNPKTGKEQIGGVALKWAD
ncbi:MAG: peptidoglycan-binding domain-containing protein [Alphaproteobacteria bacterium]